jgi:hypothetical protein
MTATEEIERMIAQVRSDRTWFRDHRHLVEAAACAIREKALRDALEVVKRAA